eukprot:TRINITY_DN87655_c0_g1_i1.p1 TRINITY_DN87655_c0_g1~~TRINITY_DN87655_c0_g1_i1.p1  ORF type:complete len:763 (-),score=205.12 TRINITY_DN87655_c0_g1_i1:360-2567(-)
MAQHSMMMDDGSDEESVHSAVSNASDFQDDEDFEYLAMEVVNHLPADKAEMLLRNLRTKETAVQDLLHRNRHLLESMRKLDDENQELEDRLKEVMEKGQEEKKAPAPAPSTPSVQVDNSIFLQMQGSKDEQILRLQRDNERLILHMRRMEAGTGQMEEALVQARKEIKKLQQGRPTAASTPQPPPKPVNSTPSELLDEEERIYRELQGKEGAGSANAAILKHLEQKQAEHSARIQQALRTLLSEDLGRIERWGSDVAAVLLAVDGVEASMKPKKGDTKKSKATPQATGGKAGPLSGEQLLEVSQELSDDVSKLESMLEGAEKAQSSLEEICRGLHDGTQLTMVNKLLEGPMELAERESEWMRDHNKEWVERARALRLDQIALALTNTEAALQTMLRSAPPGLMPINVEEALRQNVSQISELCTMAATASKEFAELQDENISFGRHIQALQAAHGTHRIELGNEVLEELRRTAVTFEPSLGQMRSRLQQQGEMMTQLRDSISTKLQELAAQARTGTASGGVAAPAAVDGGNEALMAGLREIRGMSKRILANFKESSNALESRMDMIARTLAGEEEKPTEAAKKKKGKKKGPQGQTSAPASGSRAGGSAQASTTPATPQTTAIPASSIDKDDEDDDDDGDEAAAGAPSALRSSEAVRRPSGGEAARSSKKPLKGNELLEELKALKDDAEALEARMEQRAKTRTPKAECSEDIAALLDEAEQASGSKPVKAARKKRFV